MVVLAPAGVRKRNLQRRPERDDPRKAWLAPKYLGQEDEMRKGKQSLGGGEEKEVITWKLFSLYQSQIRSRLGHLLLPFLSDYRLVHWLGFPATAGFQGLWSSLQEPEAPTLVVVVVVLFFGFVVTGCHYTLA